MGINAPSEKLPVAKKGPSEVASDKQKDLLAQVEKEQQIDHKEYAEGNMGVSSDERKTRTPEQIAKFPLLEKGKTYLAKGAVNRVPFKQDIRDKHWYYEMAVAGKKLIENFDSVAFDFPALKNKQYKARMKAAIEKITVSSVDLIADKLTPEQFKAKIEEGFSKDEIYGSQGIFNIILAFGRAYDLVNNVQEGASIDYRLSLSNKRYSQLLAKKMKTEKKAEKVGDKSDAVRQNIAEKAKKMGKGMGEMFNEVMEDYFAQNRKLVERIALAVENGKMTPEEAKGYRDALDNLNYKNAVSSNEASDEDVSRLALVNETIDRVTTALDKIDKSTEKPAEKPAAPQESYNEREMRANAMRIINEGNLEKRYAWKDESAQDVESMVKRIAHDVVAAVNPADAPADIEIPRYEEALYALIRASLRNELRDRKTARENNQTVAPEYVLNENEKVRYVSTVLGRMDSKAIRIQRYTPHF